MLYKLLMNYLRIRMGRAVLMRIFGKRFLNSKNQKTMNIATYALELLGLLKATKKSPKPIKSRR